MPITPAHLELVQSFEDLADLFYRELGWPSNKWRTFGGVAALYGLHPEDIPGVVSLAAVEKLSEDQTWGIFLVDFGESELKRSELRRILQKVADRARQEHANPTWPHENILFVCRSKGNTWTLGYYRGDALANAKLRTFGWDDPGKSRTALENLARLRWELLPEWADAWNVERLTKAFFDDYRIAFVGVEAHLLTVIPDQDTRRSFVQSLFNRLMFLCFLQRKEWMEYPKGDIAQRSNYIFHLYANYEQLPDERGFYDRLRTLFFSGLSSPNGKGGDTEETERRIGRVPFLNGGLFDPSPTLDRKEHFVPNEAFAPILGPGGLFQSYNFTVTEATPMDEDVAIDPEMLGKVFEELVTGRHESGSYYTPRPVVSFMCRQALKGYLGGFEDLVDKHDASGIAVPAARPLVEKLERIKVCDPACGSGAYLLGMLQEIHQLQIILDTTRRQSENVEDRREASRDDHMRKQTIIENCLYGVDLDPFATTIACLRLWLALVIEDLRNPLDDADFGSEQWRERYALPNLDFKVVVGDALSAQPPDAVLDLNRVGLAIEAISRYREEKRSYLHAHEKAEKDRLKSHLAELRAEINTWLRGDHAEVTARHEAAKLAQAKAPDKPALTLAEAALIVTRKEMAGLKLQPPPLALDWAVEFVEAFVQTSGHHVRLSGFDVIVANPPYVRADAQFKHIKDEEVRREAIEDWKEYRDALKRSGNFETLHEKWDLYVPFLERAHQLLGPNGQMVFIIPDAYNTAKYAGKSHAYFLEHSVIERIDFCSEIPLFSAGVFNTILHFCRGRASDDHVPTRARRFGKVAGEFETGIELLPNGLQKALAERLFRFDISTVTTTSAVLPLAEICYISVGMVIHADEKRAHLAFKASELIQAYEDDKHPKKFFRGKDMERWSKPTPSYLEWGTDRAPKLFRRQTFDQLYEVPEKLISMDLAGDRPRVIYDDQQLFHNHSAWSFVPWHSLNSVRNRSLQKTALFAGETSRTKPRMARTREELEVTSRGFSVKYLLGIMNSGPGAAWMNAHRKNKMHIFPDDWREFPIPIASDADRAAIEALVQRILDLKECEATDDLMEDLKTSTSDNIAASTFRALHGEQDIPAQIAALEAEIDARVEFLYFHAGEAPTYDEWLAKREAEAGTAIAEIRALIREGETNSVEFKETLEFVDRPPAGLEGEALNQWRTTQQKLRVHEVLKTICAFMNASGGTLLIGVHDRGSVPGIAPDLTLISRPEDRNADGFERKLRALCDTRFNRRPIGLLEVDLRPIDGSLVCRVKVSPSPEPFYLDNEFFVRDGNRTLTLVAHERDEYIARRRAAGA